VIWSEKGQIYFRLNVPFYVSDSVSQLITVDESFFTEKIGSVGALKLKEVEAGVSLVLSLG